jgi:hypothetical protein
VKAFFVKLATFIVKLVSVAAVIGSAYLLVEHWKSGLLYTSTVTANMFVMVGSWIIGLVLLVLFIAAISRISGNGKKKYLWLTLAILWLVVTVALFWFPEIKGVTIPLEAWLIALNIGMAVAYWSMSKSWQKFGLTTFGAGAVLYYPIAAWAFIQSNDTLWLMAGGLAFAAWLVHLPLYYGLPRPTRPTRPSWLHWPFRRFTFRRPSWLRNPFRRPPTGGLGTP